MAGEQTPQRKPWRAQALGLLGWIVTAYFAAAVGAGASVDASTFYGQLTKPGWAPPAYLFGPVWSVLYTMMGVASWLIWKAPGRTHAALGVYLMQLAINALWSWLFFAWHLGAAAFADVALMCILIAATIGAFWRLNHFAALLLMPYLLWVSFASALTWAVWQGNPALL
ncbi:TspO/MBR family protein [Piscinibacter terrae]|uniref:TspO/MBR family protein n=1 Tax=Piscinibacter terrae TaxID=2496871 RepID=UPI001F338787|nr:TspO/MBR family protein [Albitalea terrae]